MYIINFRIVFNVGYLVGGWAGIDTFVFLIVVGLILGNPSVLFCCPGFSLLESNKSLTVLEVIIHRDVTLGMHASHIHKTGFFLNRSICWGLICTLEVLTTIIAGSIMGRTVLTAIQFLPFSTFLSPLAVTGNPEVSASLAPIERVNFQLFP